MNLLLSTILGFFFISIFGTLAHFMYDWLNHKKWAAIFFAVNESTWEHIKIALTPFFAWSVIEIPLLISNPNFIFAKLISVMLLILVMPVLACIYPLFTKKNYLVVDILIFYITIFISQFAYYKIMNLTPVSNTVIYISFVILLIIWSSYLLLTLLPLKSDLFKDPINKKYGLEGHGHKH